MGCKYPAATYSAKPTSCILSNSGTKQGSSQSTSAAINIPSPPLSPNLNYGGDDDVDDDLGSYEQRDDRASNIFSSRYHHYNVETDLSSQDQLQHQQDKRSIFCRSSSAPDLMLPLRKQSSGGTPAAVGFTFSSNLSVNQPKEERESYVCLLNKMEQDYWRSVSTIRSTYFFDGIGRGGGFLAIPHLASHGNAKTNAICRLLEAWLTKKLVEPTISDSIPVLEDNIQSSVQSIEHHLRADPKVWVGISQAFIHIRCGHVFMLDACCDDETIVHLGAAEFYQDYPLFVDVEIKMQEDPAQQPRRHPAEVLIAFQNVVNRDKGPGAERPYVHRMHVSEISALTIGAGTGAVLKDCTSSTHRQSLEGGNRLSHFA
ncbi:hypothetical protein BGZ54_007670 [Gamsiella multidivaricata]|nr:hypothetical protein BGZ54_007670 [Gamsiella multidivaricata]